MSKDSEPTNGKLRSSEPDLVVVVGDEEKEYHCHSQVMATHSKVIDAMLATSIMRESQTGRITFPDLAPNVWESMFSFLDPSAARQMTVQDALLVAGAYDKYDFCAGTKCCDQVFFELFGTVMPHGRHDPNEKPEDLNQLIDVFLLADAANLKQTKERAVKHFEDVLNSAHKIIFSENQIKKLAPLIVKENLLEGSSFTNDEILHSLFPKLFVMSGIMFKTKQVVERAVVGIRLSAACFSQAIEFTADSSCTVFKRPSALGRICTWLGAQHDLTIRKLHGDWVIYAEIHRASYETVLWTSHFSGNMPLPPESRWTPNNRTSASGEPKIEYLYRNN
jgi:hypothetical protein